MRRTLQNLGFALVVGAVFALSPQTSTHLRYSLLGGAAVAAGVFGFGLWRRHAAPGEPPPRPTFARAPALVWASLLALALALLPTADWLIERWRESIFRNSYGAFVPLAMALLARAALRRDPDPRPHASPAGFVPIGLGLALVALDSGIRTRYLATLGLVACLPGLSLLLLGARRTRRLTLPLALGVSLIPVPNVFASPLGLRDLTAAGMSRVLGWMGVLTAPDRTLFLLPGDESYVVSDNCAGFQLLLAGLAMSTLLALSCRSRWRGGLLFAAVIPLALAANILRSALLLSLTYYVGPQVLVVPLVHGGTGILAFWLLFLGLVLIADPRRLRGALA